jgi:hypothetical protein
MVKNVDIVLTLAAINRKESQPRFGCILCATRNLSRVHAISGARWRAKLGMYCSIVKITSPILTSDCRMDHSILLCSESDCN